MSDTVEWMLIVLLVRIVQLPLQAMIFVNDISKIFIQREPNGKRRKVSTTLTDFMVLRILLPIQLIVTFSRCRTFTFGLVAFFNHSQDGGK